MNNKYQTRDVVRVALIIQLAALVILAVFRSQELLSYTYDLPNHPVSESLVTVAERWNEQMENIGASALSEKIVEFVETLRGGDEF